MEEVIASYEAQSEVKTLESFLVSPPEHKVLVVQRSSAALSEVIRFSRLVSG